MYLLPGLTELDRVDILIQAAAVIMVPERHAPLPEPQQDIETRLNVEITVLHKDRTLSTQHPPSDAAILQIKLLFTVLLYPQLVWLPPQDDQQKLIDNICEVIHVEKTVATAAADIILGFENRINAQQARLLVDQLRTLGP